MDQGARTVLLYASVTAVFSPPLASLHAFHKGARLPLGPDRKFTRGKIILNVEADTLFLTQNHVTGTLTH